MVSPSDKQMLRDANGDLIPQYWDVVEQDFKPLTGQGGANDVRLIGSIELHRSQNTIPSQGVLEIELNDLEKAKEIILSIGTNSRSAKYDISAFNTTFGSVRFGKTLREVTVEEIEGNIKTTRTSYVAQAKFEVWGNSMKVLIKRVDTGSASLYGDLMIMGVY